MTTQTMTPAHRFQLPRPTLFGVWIAILALLCGFGLMAGILVFVNGLSITGLSDRVPWGVWITIDLSAIGLGAGAFLLSAAVYLLGLKRYEPVARLAVFVGLLGYTSALLTLLLDIGRPDRFWHGWVYWNTHSVMWEIIMCISLYSGVLTVEFATIVAEHPFFARWPWVGKLAHQAHKLMPVLAVVGAVLSLLHQSSLGATYGVIKARPVWYKPTMPLMFIAQAIATSPALIVALSLIVSKLRGRELINKKLLWSVATFSGFALLVYVYMRFWDYLAMDYSYLPVRAESMALLTEGALAPYFWIGEVLLGALVPLILLFHQRLRKSDTALIAAGLLMAVALIVNRWNTNMVGQLGRPTGADGLYRIGVAQDHHQLRPHVGRMGHGGRRAGLLAAGLYAGCALPAYLQVGRRRAGHDNRTGLSVGHTPICTGQECHQLPIDFGVCSH